jgi:hypothetical protein
MGIIPFRFVALGASLVFVGSYACSSEMTPVTGSCVVDSNPELACGRQSDGTVDETLGLVGYSCTGRARPDDQATFIEGVPRGTVCADRGPVGASLAKGYCCTKDVTSCAYNPVAICDPLHYGYQCRGANRPESFNSTIHCGQGVRRDDLIDYCCSGTPQPDGCLQSDSVRCSPRLSGWTCLGKNKPKGEQLGANKSRADLYYLLCPVPTPAPNPDYNNYCCYPPALVPIGGSCIENNAVPGCASGRFGFACYGPDTPDENYLPMRCREPGFAGKSAEGYPATLYCCDFE